MAPHRHRLRRFVAIVVLGGIGVGVCLAALVPGVVTIAASSRYSGRVGPLLHRLDEPTTVFDSQGSYLDTLGLHDRRPTRLSDVPKALINAVIATEDRTFYDNPGVDVQAMVRAFVSNVGSGVLEQGGSTITQQLVKNRFFNDPKRDLDRKIREAALAIRLNEEWSKNHILEEYLNTVYFGQGSYGVKSAAERFFDGTPLERLDLAQAALLAGVISNPDGYNPFVYPDRARSRRTEVLRGMVKQHYITDAEARFAGASPLPAKKPPAELRADNYYVDEVKSRLLADTRLGATYQERYNKVFLGGLRVYTAYDQHLQDAAQAAVSGTLPDTRFTAGMAAIDPTNGDVKAIVAGPGFERSQFNLATMPPPHGRQPGSTFKAVVLATALENGFSPNDSVDGTSPCKFTKRGYGTGQTRNAEGGGGIMSIRDATVHSVNCAYFRIGAAVGPNKVVEMAHRLGVQRDRTVGDFLSTSIGSSSGVSPLDMATVFATFAADGVRHDPVFIKKVEDAGGHVIFTDKGEGVRAIAPEIARTVTNVLRGVITEGTGTRARLKDRVAAGKTGTTDQETNAWFTGYTPQLAASVWMGDPTAYTPMTRVGQFSPVYGGTYPAIIWQKFMTAALMNKSAPKFVDALTSLWPSGRFVNELGRQKLAFPPPTTTTTGLPAATSTSTSSSTTTSSTTTTAPGP